MNSNAHMARHRFAARGNALPFPLPLEDLFLALQSHRQDLDQGQPLQLPRAGAELAHVARVLLKTNKESATSETDIKTLIHQDIVRREAGRSFPHHLANSYLQCVIEAFSFPGSQSRPPTPGCR